jgi:hypothetical protein
LKIAPLDPLTNEVMRLLMITLMRNATPPARFSSVAELGKHIDEAAMPT